MTNNNVHILNTFLKSEDKISFFKNEHILEKSIILNHIDLKQKKYILENLNDHELIEILEFLDPDEVADIIQLLYNRRKNRIINKLNKETKKKVDFLLKFSSHSAAGNMSLNYIIIEYNSSKKEILEKIKKHLSTGKKEPSIFVLNNQGHFLGELRISHLIFDKTTQIYDNINSLPTIIYNEDQEEVIDIFKKNKKEKIVVLDEFQNIMGVIHARDIFKVIEQENTEDFYGLAGLHKDEDITDKAFTKVKFRLKWLGINLITAFLAAFVVSMFENTLSQIVLLAAFMPIVAGMGGNAGTQTTAILIRSLALKKIDSKEIKSILGNEMFAGLINGTIVGIIVTLIAYLFNQNLLFGLIAGVSVITNIIIASIFGTLIPLTLKSFGFDPASSSSVFVTTSTDVLGFLIFLGLATIFLL